MPDLSRETAAAFDAAAGRYESWYETPYGRRADRVERGLIATFLRGLAPLESVLEIGCGSGHFLPSLESGGLAVFGLDRSASMLRVLRQLGRDVPVVRGDAQALPFGNGSVSVSLMVTTLEFVADPDRALAEAVRVAERGLIVIGLHRCSPGGLRRRFRRSALLARAQDLDAGRLRALIEHAAGERLDGLELRKALPAPGVPLAFGDVIGAAARLGAGTREEDGRTRGK